MKNERYLLAEAEKWLAEGLITPEIHRRIRERYALDQERKRLLIHSLLSIGVVLVLAGVFFFMGGLSLSSIQYAVVLVILAAGSLVAGRRLYQENPSGRAGHALIALGAMFYLGAVWIIGFVDRSQADASAGWLLLIGGAPLAGIGWAMGFLRLHAVGLALCCAAAGHGLFRLGFPLGQIPFVVAILLIGLALGLRKQAPSGFTRAYMALGLSVASFWAWIRELSLPAHALSYAILFSGLIVGILLHGIRERDEELTKLGIGLLILNVYTQYYMIFWEGTPKALFFLIGGLITLAIGVGYERFAAHALGRPARRR